MPKTSTMTTVEFTAAEFLHMIKKDIFGGRDIKVDYVIREVGADPMDRFPGHNEVVGVRISCDGTIESFLKS